jgi:parallel beta-helix repeat protein
MPRRAGAFPLGLSALVAVVLAAGLSAIPAGALTVPSVPRSLVVSAGPGAGAVSLAWLAPTSAGASPITDFGVTKSIDGGVSYSAVTYFGSTALSAQSTSVPFLACAKAAPGGLGCRYRVFARNAIGTSAASNTVISWVTPSVPRARKAAASDPTHLRLTWAAPATTGGFALQYGVWSGSTLLATTSSTSAVVSCATPGAVRCLYGIEAHDSNGLGFKSVVGSVSFLTKPGAPLAFAVTHTANDYVSGTAAFHLAWQAPKTGLPADHYQYQSCQVAVGATLACASTTFVPKTGLPTTGATSVDTICSGGFATCGYRVRGVNALGVAGAYATLIYGPSAPFYPSAEPGPSAGQVSLSFSAPSSTGAAGSASYVVRECTGTSDCSQQANWPAVLTVPAPASSPLTVPCPADTTCRLRLEYVDGAGARSVASPQATTVPVNRPCTRTISAPASISSAESTMSPGGVLCLNGGVYQQAVSLDRSGTATASITVESTPGQHAVIDGTGLALNSSGSLLVVKGGYVEVLGIEFRNSTGRGVTVSGSNNTVAYSTFHDMQFNALVATGPNNLIQGNEAYNTVMSNANGAFGSHGWAEAMNTWQATNVTFRDNYIHDNWGEGINFISSTGSVADGNTVMNNFSVQIYNGNSKNSTITNNHLSITNSTHSRAGSQTGVLLSEESCAQKTSNIMISNNDVAGGTIGVGYWWTGCGGANNSYDHVTITGNTVTAPTAVRFDTVGASSPAPFANVMQGNTISGTVSIGQRSAWTIS